MQLLFMRAKWEKYLENVIGTHIDINKRYSKTLCDSEFKWYIVNIYKPYDFSSRIKLRFNPMIMVQGRRGIV